MLSLGSGQNRTKQDKTVKARIFACSLPTYAFQRLFSACELSYLQRENRFKARDIGDRSKLPCVPLSLQPHIGMNSKPLEAATGLPPVGLPPVVKLSMSASQHSNLHTQLSTRKMTEPLDEVMQPFPDSKEEDLQSSPVSLSEDSTGSKAGPYVLRETRPLTAIMERHLMEEAGKLNTCHESTWSKLESLCIAVETTLTH